MNIARTTTKNPRSMKADELRAARLELLPAGDYLPASDGFTAVVVATNTAGQACAYGFRGRSMKAAFRYRFPNVEGRDKYAADWLAAENQVIAERQARQAAARAPHSLAVGDVLYSSWGYEQTNVDFYEVIAVRGAVVDLMQLKQSRDEIAVGMQVSCRARKGEFIGEPIKGKRPNGQNAVRINSCCSARPWDGRPLHWSSYH